MKQQAAVWILSPVYTTTLVNENDKIYWMQLCLDGDDGLKMQKCEPILQSVNLKNAPL